MRTWLSILGAGLVFSLTSSVVAQPFDDRYVFHAGSATIAPGSTGDVAISLDAVPGTAGSPIHLSGWSYGLCHDPAVASVVDVVNGVATATVNNGSPPAFNSINTSPVPGSGFTIGTIIDLFGFHTLPPGAGYEINVATYQMSTNAVLGSSLDFCDTLATPPVEPLIIESGGAPVIPIQNSGLLDVAPPKDFIRGDGNDDGQIQVSDVVFIAKALFGLGPVPACEEAADVNGNDLLEPLIDPLYLLQFLFLSGPAPDPPFPTCGWQPLSTFSCSSPTACP